MGVVPDFVPPMLATDVDEVPTAEGWAFEVKWDGVRGQVLVSGNGELRVFTRRGREVSVRLPELRALAPMLRPGTRVDGELVVQREDGSTDFQAVMTRLTRQRVGGPPVVFLAFDVLALDGVDTTPLPYIERRQRLAHWPRIAAGWYAPEHQVGQGPALFVEVCRRGLEGLVAKKLTSAYRPGKKSIEWRKLKNPEHVAYERVRRARR